MSEFSEQHPGLVSAFYFAVAVGVEVGSAALAFNSSTEQADGIISMGSVVTLALAYKSAMYLEK